MALTPLTRVQQATVIALVEARRLDVVPADVARAASFLRQSGWICRAISGGNASARLFIGHLGWSG